MQNEKSDYLVATIKEPFVYVHNRDLPKVEIGSLVWVGFRNSDGTTLHKMGTLLSVKEEETSRNSWQQATVLTSQGESSHSSVFLAYPCEKMRGKVFGTVGYQTLWKPICDIYGCTIGQCSEHEKTGRPYVKVHTVKHFLKLLRKDILREKFAAER